MADLLNLVAVLLPAAYVAIFGLYLRHFLNSDESPGFAGSAALFGVLGLHSLYMVLLGIETQHFPIATQAEFFSLLALSVGASYALAERWHRDANTGVFFVAIVLAFQLLSALYGGDPGAIPERTRNPVYSTHVILTVFGFAGLTVSSLYGLMYIMLSQQLKSRQLGLIFRRLPPLSVLEKLSKAAMTSGVVLLGLGLALGHYVAFAQYGQLNLLDHPTILVADVAWVGYTAGLIVSRARGLSGTQMGYFALFGYLSFMAAMAVVLTQFGAFHTFQ